MSGAPPPKIGGEVAVAQKLPRSFKFSYLKIEKLTNDPAARRRRKKEYQKRIRRK